MKYVVFIKYSFKFISNISLNNLVKFKFSNSKALFLSLFPILFIHFSNINLANSALSATTANTIKGTSPRFTPEIENTIDTDFVLFGLTDGSNSYFTQDDIDQFLLKDLKLDPKSSTPKSITDKLSFALGQPSSDQVVDIDGDNDFSIAKPSGGYIFFYWFRIDNGEGLWPEYQSKTFCELVAYERTPELRVSGNIILSTKYGDPSNQIYPDSNLSLKQPQRIYNLDAAFGNDKDILCFAQPNLIASSDGYRGPSDQWWDRGGFYQQSNAQSNFPTSGFDSAFFYLRTAGIYARKLKFNPSSFTQGSVSVNIEIVTRDSIKVTLNGPNFQNPSPFVSPGQIVIKDIDNRINYPFELKNWFIANPNSIENYAKAESYCNGLTGYHLPKRWDLTNNDSIKFSNCSGSGNDASTPGQQCTAGHYIRKLNDGSLLAEWGSLANGYYPDSQWVNTDYWTSDSFSYAGTYRYVVHPSGGRILIFRESDDRDVRVTCVND